MTTVTCKRCGHNFPTEARTNTRCRRCRTVVNIGRPGGAGHPRTAASEALYDGPGDPSDDRPGFAPAGLVGIGLVGAGGFALWHGLMLRPIEDADPTAVRRTRLVWCCVGAVLLVTGVVVVVRRS